MNTTTILRHKNGKILRATTKLDFFCANDLEEILGLGRINTRAMNTCKIKVLERGGRRTQGKVFIHKDNLPRLLLRSKRSTKVSWLQDLLLGPQEKPKPKPKGNPNEFIEPAPDSEKLKMRVPHYRIQQEVQEVIVNWWTRIPRQACEQLEEAVGLDGLYRSLHDEDMRLRREDNEKKNAAKL